MPALYPASGESDYQLWRKILTNPGGSNSYSSGEPEHSIKKKILRNQQGTFYPNGTDSEEITVRKILRNQAAALISECGRADPETPSSSDSMNRSLARILINQNGASAYRNAMHDNAILKNILRNQAEAVDAAAGDLPTLTQIQKVIGPCVGGVVPLSTNYIELPIITAYKNNVGGGNSYSLQYRGVMQVWEGGAVVFLAGETESNDPSANVFEVWVGSSPTVGAYVTVAATVGGGGWNASTEKVILPGAGESVYLISGDRGGTGYLTHVPAFAYPGGWSYPIDFILGYQGGTPSAPTEPYQDFSITRIADTIHYTGDWVNTGSFIGLLYSWDSYDTDDWSVLGFLIRHNQSPAIPAFDYSAATFADATLGPAFQGMIAISGSNQIINQFTLGPFLRAAPTVQQGTYPE